MNFVLSLPDGQVKFFENSNYKRTVYSNLLIKKHLGLVKVMFGLVYMLDTASPNGKLCTLTYHDWSGKRAIVDLPIRMKRNSKHVSSKSLHPFGFTDVTK